MHSKHNKEKYNFYVIINLTIYVIKKGEIVYFINDFQNYTRDSRFDFRFFTIKGLKRSASYQSDQYDHYLLLLIALESVALPIWVFLT